MSVATMLSKAAPGRPKKQVTGVRMPHGASGPSGAFFFPADLGGMGKLTGLPNDFAMSFLVVGARGNFFCEINKDSFFFFGQNRRLWELDPFHLLVAGVFTQAKAITILMYKV